MADKVLFPETLFADQDPANIKSRLSARIHTLQGIVVDARELRMNDHEASAHRAIQNEIDRAPAEVQIARSAQFYLADQALSTTIETI